MFEAAAKLPASAAPRPKRTVVRGWKIFTASVIVAGVTWCSSATLSSTQNDRPCVAAMRSPSLIVRSWMGTTGRLSRKRLPAAAVVERDVDAGFGAGVEQALAPGSSRMTRVKSVAGMPSTIFSTSSRSQRFCRGKACHPAACTASPRHRPRLRRCGDGSMMLTSANSGRSGDVTFVHVAPLSRDTCT